MTESAKMREEGRVYDGELCVLGKEAHDRTIN